MKASKARTNEEKMYSAYQGAWRTHFIAKRSLLPEVKYLTNWRKHTPYRKVLIYGGNIKLGWESQVYRPTMTAIRSGPRITVTSISESLGMLPIGWII